MKFLFKAILFFTSAMAVSSCTQEPSSIISHTSPRNISVAKSENPFMLVERNGEIVRLEKPAFHIVREGDTLEAVAKSYNVDVEELANANGLNPSSSLEDGSKLNMPSSSGYSAFVGESSAPVNDEQVAGGSNKVVQESKIPHYSYNDSDSSSEIVTKDIEPSTAQNSDSTAPFANEETVTAEDRNEFAEQLAKFEEELMRDSKAATTDSGKKTESLVKGGSIFNSGAPQFTWPVQGKIISDFGPKDGGLYNDGVNIAAQIGDDIMASEGGEVVYSGNELRGYGNLLLIKHNDGYLTAYAHARELLVKKGDIVTKGQLIAHVGNTGHVSKPQLHFSIRKGSKAVDPKKYLPKVG